MKTLLSLIFGISIVGFAAAQAMPFHSAQAGLTIPVSSGCGIGVHRGPDNGCNAIYGGYYYRDHYGAYYRGYYDGYHDGYYDGSGSSLIVDHGACSGGRIYRVCNVYGTCWAACD